MNIRLIISTIIAACPLIMSGQLVESLADYGVKPGKKDVAQAMSRALVRIKAKAAGNLVVIKMAPGIYEFHPAKADKRTYYISNHDQPNPKSVGIAIEDWDNVTIDGQGADLRFHGRMLPVSAVRSRNVTLRNFSIDFPNPHITQAEIVSNDAEDGIVFDVAPWAKVRNTSKGLEAYGEGWALRPRYGIAFDGTTRHMVYRTSDIRVSTDSVVSLGGNRYRAPRWKDSRLTPGTIVAMRTGQRPAPGIFVGECANVELKDVTVHYAEGMGLLAQMTDSIRLDGFSVKLRGGHDQRYFTTQADATHFSGCKGLIECSDGVYEGMMDDAVNIHGTYLRVRSRKGSRMVEAEYMHPQSYGFVWGFPGDSVQILSSATMDLLPGRYGIASIRPIDKPTSLGAKIYEITFDTDIPEQVDSTGFGLENLSWTPEVKWYNNVVRNNRARGALFSTPRRTEVLNNNFDHTSGSAILLCGDCNGWFETGACRDVLISGNIFNNALTNLFQFTEAVISIYPEIPDLGAQKSYFHGGKNAPGIRVENNRFLTFDAPLLYAKSTQGLSFKNNVITLTHDFKPFHRNTHSIWLQRVKDADIIGNTYENGARESILIE